MTKSKDGRISNMKRDRWVIPEYAVDRIKRKEHIFDHYIKSIIKSEQFIKIEGNNQLYSFLIFDVIKDDFFLIMTDNKTLRVESVFLLSRLEKTRWFRFITQDHKQQAIELANQNLPIDKKIDPSKRLSPDYLS